ncbi:hypothetical protein H6G27_16460 [Nostoc linckia FACHB-104]|nr:hypothetical protein [Nostoc linckia FACHB-104]
MAAFQFQRPHKAPSQENHESFFKQQGSHGSHFFSSTQATSSQAIAQRQEDTLNSQIQRQEEPQKEEV